MQDRDGAVALAVGVIGGPIPATVIEAMGGRMTILNCLDAPTPQADRLAASEPASLRRYAEPALDGRLRHLDLLVVDRAREWLYYILKEAVRTGHDMVPPLLLCDVLPSLEPAARRHNRRQTERLAETLARLSGRPLDPARLVAAIDRREEVRAALRRVQSLRDEGRLFGAAALAITDAARGPDQDAFRAAIVDLSAPTEGSRHQGPRLVLVAGSDADVPMLHRRVAAAGGDVVAEDSSLGPRLAAQPFSPGADPLQDAVDLAVLEHAGPAARARDARFDWLADQLARPDRDGVIVHIRADDRQFGWGWPAMRDRIAAAGKPVLLTGDCSGAAPEAAIDAFVAALAA